MVVVSQTLHWKTWQSLFLSVYESQCRAQPTVRCKVEGFLPSCHGGFEKLFIQRKVRNHKNYLLMKDIRGKSEGLWAPWQIRLSNFDFGIPFARPGSKICFIWPRRKKVLSFVIVQTPTLWGFHWKSNNRKDQKVLTKRYSDKKLEILKDSKYNHLVHDHARSRSRYIYFSNASWHKGSRRKRKAPTLVCVPWIPLLPFVLLVIHVDSWSSLRCRTFQFSNLGVASIVSGDATVETPAACRQGRLQPSPVNSWPTLLRTWYIASACSSS